MKTWLKGGLIGLIVSILLIIILFIFDYVFELHHIGRYIFNIIVIHSYLLIKLKLIKAFDFVTMLFLSIPYYFITGSIIGLIIQKVRK